jgi:hypothetical protein
MPEKINWTITAQVVGGPLITESQALEIEAYDKIQVTIANGDSDKEIEVQPGGADKVSFLLIRSDKYNDVDNGSVNLSFKVNDSTNDEINLDAPLLLIGNGATGVLVPGEAPQKLFFTNSLGTDNDANIEILVGRDSTP